jgi:transcriptional antiterminator RfaH
MSGENHLHQSEQKWFAVRTRSKSEKVVINRLQEQGIEVYLPLLPVTRHYTRKVKHYQLPLISCYVFVKICRQDYLSVLKTDHVVDFVRFSKNLIAIPEREIDLLRRIVGETSAVQAEPLDLEKGDLVEVIAGQLTGLQGKLVDRKGKKNFLVDLKTIGYSLRIEIKEAFLRKIPKQDWRMAHHT